MKTREEALTYGLSFPDTYQDAPFRDANWQLVRVKKSKKVFLWTYEREGLLCLNVKVTPESRDFWRGIYDSVVPGCHQKTVIVGSNRDYNEKKNVYGTGGRSHRSQYGGGSRKRRTENTE